VETSSIWEKQTKLEGRVWVLLDVAYCCGLAVLITGCVIQIDVAFKNMEADIVPFYGGDLRTPKKGPCLVV